MSDPSGCPDPAQLRRLLDEALPAAEQTEIDAHLQSCTRCQHLLETLAAGKDSWDEAGLLLAREQPTEAMETGLQDALARLEGRSGVTTGPEPTEDENATDLSFLQPPTRPASLGRLDHYEILSLVGRGGMGIVLKAFDDLLHRVVAIKVMAPALAATPQARKRFIREAQAAAAVTHDHVVTIHAVQDGPFPYLVMQFIAGVSLEEKIRRTGPLELKEILRIGVQTAAGLAAAHAQGLVHRDIKPANILLENGIQRVKITDFGLARQKEAVGLTQSGVVAGTPSYMAPEQARGDPIDFRADLFSLGSVLYAMCTGVPPFRGSTSMAILRRVSDETPRPLRQLNGAIPKELAAVVEKLHNKDAAARYQSAEEVAQALGRQLARVQRREGGEELSGEVPVQPMPRPGRRRALLAGLAVVLLAAIGASYLGFGRTLLEHPAESGNEAAPARAVPLPVICSGQTAALHDVVFSPDGETVACASSDRTILLWNSHTGETRHILTGHPRAVHALAFSPTGNILASGSEAGDVRLWDVATGRQSDLLEGHTAGLFGLAFSPDGQTLASGGWDNTIRLWDLATRQPYVLIENSRAHFIRRLLFSPDGKTLISGGYVITFWDVKSRMPRRSIGFAATSDLALPTDGRFLVAGSWRAGALALINPADGTERAVWQVENSRLEGVAVSPQGDRLASVGEDGVVRLWEPGTQRLLAQWPGHSGSINSAAFSPDGRTLATAGAEDFRVKLWDVARVEEGSRPAQPPRCVLCPPRKVLEEHTSDVKSVAFSPDGHTLASGSLDKTVRLWDAQTGKPGAVLSGHDRGVFAVAFTPDGQTLISAGGDREGGETLLWDVKAGKQVAALDGPVQQVFDIALAPGGERLASGGLEKVLRIYDLKTRNEILTVNDQQAAFTRRVSFTPDGQTLLSCGNFLNFYDAHSGELKRSLPQDESSDLKISPRRDLLAVAGWKNGKITLVDLASGKVLASWRAHSDAVEALAFSPDGSLLASASADGSAKIWDVATNAECAVLLGHWGPLYAVAFSPDGQTLASAGHQQPEVVLWDVSALHARKAPGP